MPEGRKDDHGKLPWSLLPLDAVQEILKVLHWGAYEKKPVPYGPDNWQGVENAEERYYNAAMRHLTDWWKYRNGRSVNDDESGFHILAHAACCVIFLLWFDLNPGLAKEARGLSRRETEQCPHCGGVAHISPTLCPKYCPRQP